MMEFLQEPVNLRSKKHFATVASLIVVIFLLIAIPLTVISVFKSGETAKSPKAETPAPPEAVADEILVKFKPDVAEESKKNIKNMSGLTTKKKIDRIGVEVLKVSAKDKDKVITDLTKNKAVDFAEPNFIGKVLDTIPNDPSFSQQWGPQKVKAPAAWDITTGSNSVIVAVIDTGVSAHPDLTGKILPGYDFANNDNNPTDDFAPTGHGTKVAGIIGADTNNAVGMAGLSWQSPILPVKVCDTSGNCPDDIISSGIIYATDQGAKVINISLGDSAPSSTLENAVNYAWNKGVVVVAAAGNNGSSPTTNQVLYPAAYPNVVAVGATSQDDPLFGNDQRASYSSYGSALDIVAPGDFIYSTNYSGSYTSGSGTSFSSPHVAGAAALLWAKGATTNSAVVDALYKGALDINDTAHYGSGSGWDGYYGWGRLDIYNSLQKLSVPPVDTTPPTISITSPANDATVSGSVNVTANASDNVGVARVEFYVDSVLQNTDTISPYGFTWDSTKVANGNNSIDARAFDAAGNKQADTVTVTVKNGDTTPPSTPTGLTASAAAYNRVNISWAASTDNVGVAGYWIIRGGTTIASSTTNSYSDTTVSPSTAYSYQVVSYDAAGNNSSPSNIATVTTPSAPDTQAPTVPGNLTATAASSSQINLAWTASTDNIGVTGYDVYRNSTKVATVATTSFGDTGLLASATYSYFVKARDAAGNVSAASNTASATTQPPPSTTGNITGTVYSSAGGVVSGAKISLTVGGSNKTYVTTSLGVYTITSLPAGTYTLSFSAKGYTSQSASVTVAANTTATKNITLVKSNKGKK